MQDNQAVSARTAPLGRLRMNSSIEIHDSKIISVTARDGLLEVCLSAYVHKSDGTPGRESGTGWTQDVILRFENGSIEGRVAEYPAWLSDGTLVIDGDSLENEIPIPLNCTGNAKLRLEIVNNDPVVIRGSEVHLELRGAATYVEEFPGENA